MNAQRTKQLKKLQDLAQEIEDTLETMFDDIERSAENLSDNDMEHLPVFDRLSDDLDNVKEARLCAEELVRWLDVCIWSKD